MKQERLPVSGNQQRLNVVATVTLKEALQLFEAAALGRVVAHPTPAPRSVECHSRSNWRDASERETLPLAGTPDP